MTEEEIEYHSKKSWNDFIVRRGRSGPHAKMSVVIHEQPLTVLHYTV